MDTIITDFQKTFNVKAKTKKNYVQIVKTKCFMFISLVMRFTQIKVIYFYSSIIRVYKFSFIYKYKEILRKLRYQNFLHNLLYDKIIIEIKSKRISIFVSCLNN